MEKLDKKNIEDIIALTPMQEGMLFHYLKDPDSDAYFEQLSLEISGEIDKKIFEKAWNFVIKTNEMLRAVFRWEKVENPIQVILREHQLQPKYYDFSGAGLKEVKKRLDEIKVKDRKKKFDLQEVSFRVVLCKLEEDEYEMIISNHHILYDGWSTGIILKEFFEAYANLILTPGNQGVKPVKSRFKDFLHWILQQENHKQKTFWSQYLGDFDTPTILSIKKDRNGETIREVNNYSTILEKDTVDQLEVFTAESRLTWASVFYGAWGLLLQRYCNSEDVIFGITVSGRQPVIKGIEDMVGLFINTQPLRVQSHDSTTVMDLLSQLERDLQDREKFEHTPLVEINQSSAVPGGTLFDNIFVIENYPIDQRLNSENGSLNINGYSAVEKTHYDLTVRMELSEGIKITFDYRKGIFSVESVVALGGHFREIIKKIAANKVQWVHRLEIISEQEKKQILLDFNDTAADYPRDKMIHHLFAEQVDRRPDQVALIGPKLQNTKYKLQTNYKLQITNYKQSGALRADVEAFGEEVVPDVGAALRGCPVSDEAPVQPFRQLQLTYRQLNEQSNRLAGLLIEEGVQPDMIVGIMVERSVDMIIGIFGILKAGRAYLPIDPDYPQERINYMLKDSGAELLVTTNHISSSASSAVKNLLPAAGHWLLDTSLVYIIYTSGSTGKPKGVMVEQNAVINLLFALQRRYPLGEQDTYLLKTSYLFDVSVTELFGWFLDGGRLAILEPGGEKDPNAILEMIAQEGVTHINFVPSMFQAFVEILGSSEIAKLESLKYIFLAGESLPALPVNRFRRLNTGIAIENIYGPTEAAVYASWFSLGYWKGEGSIPIGMPLPNVKLYILNKWGYLQPIEVPGELCISSTGLARGYLNQPELTKEKFVISHLSLVIGEPKKTVSGHSSFVSGKKPLVNSHRSSVNDCSQKLSPNDQCPMPNDHLYKTGDLARFLKDGNIEFLGRIDHQVKIRGFRIELGEIENRLLNVSEVKETVVLAKEEDGGDKYICAYFVSDRVYGISELRKNLSKELPDYMIPSYFIQIEKIPLAPNGKVDRKALPKPDFKVGKSFAGPRDEIEKKLVDIWSGVLGIGEKKIGINYNFFHLGGHSLKATILVLKIHKELKVNVPLQEIFKTSNIRGLAEFIKNAETVRFFAIEAVEKKEYYKLSSAQRRLLVLQQIDEKGIAYNMPSLWQIEGHLDVEKFAAVFNGLIRRHGSLRTSFHVVKEEPVQRINEKTAIGHWSLGIVKAREREIEDVIKNFIKPFDLSQAPLLRVGLIELSHTPSAPRSHPSQKGREHKYILMVDMHHIISDGMSIGILVREFIELYAGKGLLALRLQYKDYSEWQKRQTLEKSIKKQEAYWLKKFSGEIPVLDLPLDYPRPTFQNFTGSSIAFEIGREETNALKSLANEQEVTLFMLLLSLYTVCLSRLCGQEDIVVGTSIAGRGHADIEYVMGMFVNTLVLRNFPVMEMTFGQFLKEIKENTIKAFENQDYPYEDLVEQVKVERDTGRNPLFDTMFSLQNFDDLKIEIPGLKLRSLDYETHISKFDLSLAAVERGRGLSLSFQYCTKLFKKETVERFIIYFKKIILIVVNSPAIRLGEIEIITKKEKKRILYDINKTETDYPAEKTIHQFFEEQVGSTPDNTALHGCMIAWKHGEEGYITYRELNEKSNRLAQELRKKGVIPDIIVGFMTAPSVELIIGILGILKSGGAYIPIDPDYPEGRIDYMLKDSGAKLLVTIGNLTQKGEKVRRWEGEKNFEILFLDNYDSTSLPTSQPPDLSPLPAIGNRQPAASLAYVIYTSGSTGKPKGVLVEHSSVVNLIMSQKVQFNINEKERILQFSNISFDASVEQIFVALFSGAALVLIDKDTLLDPNRFDTFITSRSITHIHAVPSFLSNMKLGEEAKSQFKRVVSGGDICPVGLAAAWMRCCDFYNEYGPTETTVTSIEMRVKDIDDALPRLPIGRPINNTTVYLFDRWINPVPLGVMGELHIGGEGLARGYLNIPELTANKFIRADNSNSSLVFNSLKKRFKVTNDRLYKTGDLARWLPDGNIEFLGRIDHQVKIRGFRIEVGEIDNRLLSVSGVKEAVVVAREEDGGDKYLCAYFVSDREYGISELREYLSQELPDYMIPSYFIKLEKIPLTPNGKIDQRALPKPEIKTDDNYEAPRDRIEKKLVEIWSGVLGIEKEKIGINDNFFHLGGQSLKATLLVSRIHKELKVNVPLPEIFKISYIRGLASFIKNAKTQKFFSIAAVEKKEYYILSSAQRRLSVLQQMDEKGITYNMPSLWELEGELKVEKFETVFQELFRRHESLRTSFHVVNEEPVQVINDDIDFKIEVLTTNYKQITNKSAVDSVDSVETQNFASLLDLPGDCPGIGKNEKTTRTGEYKILPYKGFPGECRGEPCVHPAFSDSLLDTNINTNNNTNTIIRPFDLSQAPLLRVGLKKIERDHHILMVDIHHIISDGMSIGILVREFIELYAGKRLPTLRLQYRDYSEWQHRRSIEKTINQQEFYWLKEFPGEIPVLNLPTDYPRPAVQEFTGSSIAFEIDQEETNALKSIANEQGTTLFMLLLSLYTICLSRLSGQEDIVVGTPVSGRRHADIESIMGMFVNTLALRNFPNGQKTFIQFLEELKENTLKAFENQDYLYENLVEKAAVDRDTGRNPLFDTMFALQNFDALKIEIPGLKVQPLDYEIWISKFDLTLTTVETGENLLFIFEYCTKLFKQETIDRFISYFINTISTVLKCRDIKISEIEIIGEKEKNRILYEFNDTAVDYPKYKTIYHLFEEQVERTADHTALVGTKLKNTKYTFNTNPISENTGYNKGDALRAGFEVFGEIQLSYSLLNEESNHLSYALLERGVHHDNIVGIIIERSVEMIIGILGILKAGGAYLPIDLDYPQERINYILKDSGAKVLVTTGNLTKESEKTKWWEGNRNLEVVFFNTLYLPIPRNSHLPNSLTSQPLNFSLLPSTSLAYMIYTSGSTGQPKGVMIQHENLVNAAYGWLEEYKLSIIEVNLLQMAGYSFDVSCGDLCRALISGGKLIICPEDAKFNFYLLYYYLCLHRVTLFESTPSLVIPFMDYIHENRLRLKYMQLLIVGSDSFRFKDYQTIQSRYGKSMRIINSYGATEATIDSTYYESDYGDGELTISEFVPIGKPMPNIKCFIFDAYCRIKPIGVSGEIVITGSGIARGYANRPELTSERFIYFSHYSHITNQYLPEGYLLSIDENRKTKAKLYKTGDIGRWLSDANIECLGRIDHQIKIRGFRVELGEIEHRLLTYEKIKEAIVIAREDNNDKYLCAYLVTRSNVATPIDPSDLEDYLSNHMPDYMVPSYFIQLDHIPLTPNGKIDRKALPAPVLKLGDNYEAPRDGIEKKLVEIWSGVLGIEKEKIGISDNFFHLGGHSLKATLLISRIHKELKVNVPLPEIFKTPYIRGLAAFIKNSETQRFFSIVAVEKKEYYSLSSAQKRLFVLHRMDEKGIAYNMPSVWQLEGNLDIEKFAAVFHRLILRHESMRSSFYMVKDEPVQRIHDDVVFEIEYYDFPTDYTDKNYKLQNTNYKPIAIPNHKIQITNKTVPFGQILDASGGGDEEPAARDSQPAAALISSFIRPFDLSKAPLLRVGLLDSAGGGTGTENRHGHIFLMIDMHHIISDGVSMDILARDFTALYGNEVLPPLQIQYKDFSQWQNSEKKKNNIKQQETYWLKEFAGEIPLLNLPTDYVRSDLLDFAGSSLSFQIDNTLTAEIKKQASYMNVSIMMFLLSVYKILLSKFALKNDIIVGTVIAGRQHADLEPVIGFFVNMLAIRTRPNQIKSFSDYLAQIKEKTLKAYDNQGYQFEELVDKLEIPRHRNRHPLVDVVFVFNGEPQRTIKSGELAGNSINLDPRKVSHFDLMLHATDYGDSVSMIFEYSTALFKAKTIDRLSRLYLDILEQVLENGNIKLEEITSGHEFVTVKSNVLQDSQHDFDF